MADVIKIFALGGLDENGRDCYVVEINDDIFVLDAGISIPDKNFPGVDYLLPNFEYLYKNKARIRAYFMTHGHDESVGALKYFYKYAPAKVYCTETTKIIMENQMMITNQLAKMDFVVVKPSDDIMVANRRIRFFQTCHNAADSYGLAICTDQGNIVFTSDFIINFATEEQKYQFDLAKTADIAREKTLVLIPESKSASKPGYCSPRHRIADTIDKYFKNDKRIFISCYWQNLYRIREIFRLIKKYNKKLYCYDEYTLHLVNEVLMPTIGAQISQDQIIKKEDLLRINRNQLVILLLGHSDDVFDEINALGNRNNADSRIVVDERDIFINVAVPRALYETTATRSIDNLYRTGCEVVWLKSKHVSPMHACEDDLRFVINLFRPKYYLPVRGHFTDIMANAKNASALGLGLNPTNIFVLDNGMQLIFRENTRPAIIPQEVTGIDISPILVDGKGLAKKSDDILELRQKMGVDGAVVIASTVSLSEKRIICGPDCQMRGFVFVKEAEPLLKSITQIYVEEINGALMKGMTNFDSVKAVIADRVKKFIRRENGREPFIDAIILIKQ